MKKSILLGISALIGATLLSGCSDEWAAGGGATGRIVPMIGIDTDAVTSRVGADSRAQADISVADLSLRLSKADGSFSQSWPSVADFPTEHGFSVGQYTLEAYYGDAAEQGFEVPSYFGSQTITVADGKPTHVGLTASLANSMITVKYTDAFQGYMADWSATVNGVKYAKNETRPVYVTPGDVDIVVNVTKPNGLTAALAIDKIAAKARYHHTVTIDVNNGNVSDAELFITFDDNMAQEDITIDISDKVLSSPAPTVEAEGFTSGLPVEIVSGLKSDKEFSMNVIAQAGLGEVILTTGSVSLLSQGWPAEVDLIAADAAMQARLKELGFNALGLWRNPDQMAVLDFSGVLEHIRTVDSDNTTTFSVVVKDKVSRATEPIELVLAVEAVQLEMESAGKYFEPGEPLDVALSFNGDKVEDNVTMEYYNRAAGKYRPVEILEVKEQESRGTTTYIVTIAAPAVDDNELQLRATCADKATETVIKGSPYAVVIEPCDVYATGVYAKVVATDAGVAAPSLSDVKFFVSQNGGQATAVAHTEVDGYAFIEGLTPATEYAVRAEVGGVRSIAAFITTEVAAAIPNSDFEAYKATDSGDYWTRYAIDGWGTNNTMTTSQGAKYAYVRISTTDVVTDTPSGSGHALLLRTCGWGSGNTAVGSRGTQGVCKYTDAGLLHLGAERQTRPAGYGDNDNKSSNCSTGPVVTDDLAPLGLAFASRPARLAFQYKYTPKNSSDRGMAQVILYAAGDVEIANKTVLLEAQGSYTECSIPFEYKPGTPKAEKIYVKFLSSYDMEYIKRTDANFSGPGFANLSTGKFLGSQLYLDDLTLNY